MGWQGYPQDLLADLTLIKSALPARNGIDVSST
jgi:hypothetical protein